MKKSTLIFRISLINGLITGIIFSVISALIYLLDVNMFTIWFGIVILFVNLGIVIFAIIITIKKIRESVVDQSLNFGSRFLSGLIVGVIAAWVSGLFSYLLFQIIDPDFMLTQIEGFADTLMNMGLSEDDAYEKVDEIKEGLKPAEQLITGFLKTPAFYIVVSLIVSAFMKEKKVNDIENN